jgi:MFS family permease
MVPATAASVLLGCAVGAFVAATIADRYGRRPTMLLNEVAPAGATEQWALRINLLTGLVNILAALPAIALIDRVGRKPLLLAGSAGMGSP